jgi:tetratricopeptide (TPR) repeat protein
VSKPRHSALLLLLTVFVAAGAFGQEDPVGQNYVIQSSGSTPENRQRVMAARQLMNNGSYDPAAATLEIVYEQEPDNQLVAGLLKTCYYQLKQFLKAEILVRRLLERYPDQFGYRIELAELMADRGSLDSARSAYHETSAGVTVKDTVRQLLIIRSEISRGFDDDAIQLIDSLRRQAGDTLLFALERGTILEKQKKYAQVVDQYLILLAQDTTSASMEAERRLIALLGFPESAGPVESRLARESNTVRSRRVLQLLEDYNLKEGQFDKAFAYAVKRDSVEKADGSPLLYYMRRCAERKQYVQTVRMGEYALERYPSSSITILVRMSYAGALAETGRYQDAIGQYEVIRKTSPRPQEQGDALYAAASLYMNGLRNYAAALRLYDTVLMQYRFGNLYLNSLRDRSRCFVRMGNLDSAAEAYRTVGRQTNLPEFKEEASYYDGLIFLFRDQYDSCKSAMKKLMVDYPSGFYINDAIQLLMALDDASGASDILSIYANALKYSEQFEWDSARQWFDRLTLADNKALADDALHRMMQISLSVADTSATMESIERLTSGFPESYFSPYGLKIKADILMTGRGTPQQAKEIYRLLLEQYPNYPFATEVRKKLRQMEADNKIG